MNILVLSLIIIPVILGFLFLFNSKKEHFRVLSYILCAFGITFSVALAIHGPETILIPEAALTIIEIIIILLEIGIIVFIFRVAMKHKRWPVFIITVVQTVLFIYSTLNSVLNHVSEKISFNIDYLSIVMLLIINIIGTLIVVFANGYMTEYEHHKKMKSRQNIFYFIICIFLAAMNGLVISDSLSWVYFFWEITTIASFLLISYNLDEEGYNSGFRALFLNLIGGICFSLGNILLLSQSGITTLTGIVEKGHLSGIYLLPVFLLCVAGFAKSAQMPFQSWLLGAMVAPTPVSALLHSSTMVKAGVFLIIKLSPAYAGTNLGTAIAIYGGFTFLITSAIAVTQSNAKRVLAYSTIANLGLIICSAGLGTSVAISAAIILLIFHAISKALLFLCTGQIEHTIGSRDIEDMHGLIHKAPVLTLITCFGLISMILPPFGVLVTKLISIEAAAINPMVVIFLILGSALTTLYYIKWLGSLLSYPEDKVQKHPITNIDVYLPLWILSIGALITSIFIGPIFNNFVKPQIETLLPNLHQTLTISKANVTSQIGSFNNEVIFIVLGILIVVIFLVRGLLVNNTVKKDIYMCGENNLEDTNYFRTSDGTPAKSNIGNYYLVEILNEKSLTNLGYIISIAMLLIVILGGL
ncbi:MAG: NADH-quinone oxidoreductase subunit L [Clostridiaceae bacterium]|nr:NADH-quinone oxidoreductase subunit L [Clostridiaceae bacterium]